MMTVPASYSNYYILIRLQGLQSLKLKNETTYQRKCNRCVKVKVAQSCPTLCDATDYMPEYWSGQPFPSPEDLPNPGIEPGSPALQADSLPAEPQGKPNRGLLLLLLSRFSRVRLCATHRWQPTRPPVPGILQARTLEWVAISFSNA